MVKRGYLTDHIKGYLKEGNMILEIVRTSTDLEQLLTENLFFKQGIKFKLIENWTLGNLINWNHHCGFIDDNSVTLLNLFNRLRNIVFHRRTFIEKILLNQEQKNIVQSIILSVCDFIESSFIDYDSNSKIENEYEESFTSVENKYRNFLNESYNFFNKPEEQNE